MPSPQKRLVRCLDAPRGHILSTIWGLWPSFDTLTMQSATEPPWLGRRLHREFIERRPQYTPKN